jgi:3-oxoacyl-[acyl-carrier protein] reductase
MDLGIKGRVALITGSARGLGLAEAKALAAEGVAIAINDVDRGAAEQAVSRLKEIGTDAVPFVGDAADEAVAVNLTKQIVSKLGRLDILVNNAGIGVLPSYQVADMPADAWDRMVHVHMRSTFLWTREAIPFMRSQGWGRIINTSSMNYTGGGRPGASHYVAAKAGVAGFTRTVAKEVGSYGITANAIAPGYVETDLIGGFTPEMLAMIRDQNPMRRLCTPREIGSAVAFLASNNSGFINGELLCIDGGRREFYWGE